MAQTITILVKLLPTKEQDTVLTAMSAVYIATINELVTEMVETRKLTRKTSKHLAVSLPSAVKSQAIQDAKSVYRKAKKKQFERIPVLKKPVCIWNNQNYSVSDGYIAMPILVDGKVKKTPIRTMFDKDGRIDKLLQYKLGTLRLTKKSNVWMAQISITIPLTEPKGNSVMGIDLGLKVPAVAVTEQGTVRFFGKGRQNKYKKRKFHSIRKHLGKAKKLSSIRKLNDKEQRYMKDEDHKISKAIVDFANEQNISVIRLERLANIRQTARTSRKNEKNLHTWSFHRLSAFIEYKARLAGIRVEYVNPRYTSQTCPNCMKRNKAKDRMYACSCGFTTHRDIVGAMNIRYAPVMDGNSPSA